MLGAIQVTPDGFFLSWEAIGTMTTISAAVCSVAVAYLRAFVGGKLKDHEANVSLKLATHETHLATFKGELTKEIQESGRQTFLGRHVGEIVDARLQGLEQRLVRLEEERA